MHNRTRLGLNLGREAPLPQLLREAWRCMTVNRCNGHVKLMMMGTAEGKDYLACAAADRLIVAFALLSVSRPSEPLLY